jgi:hypothetical protein
MSPERVPNSPSVRKKPKMPTAVTITGTTRGAINRAATAVFPGKLERTSPYAAAVPVIVAMSAAGTRIFTLVISEPDQAGLLNRL